MDHRIKSYLRMFRRRIGFTQNELAFLLGSKSRTSISRIEQSNRKPSLETLVLAQFIFDVPSLELFPTFILGLQDAALKRVNELYEELQGEPSKATRVKLDFLEQLLTKSERSV